MVTPPGGLQKPPSLPLEAERNCGRKRRRAAGLRDDRTLDPRQEVGNQAIAEVSCPQRAFYVIAKKAPAQEVIRW